MGFYASLSLMKDLNGTIPVKIWDLDTFAGGNGWKRLPNPLNKNTFKVKHLKDLCQFVMRVKGPEVHTIMLTPQVLDVHCPTTMEGILVVDATDEPLPDRRKFKKLVSERGGWFMRGSYDGNGMVVLAEGLPLTKAGVTDGGYDTEPSASVAMMGGGALAVSIMKFIRTGEYTNQSFQVDPGFTNITRGVIDAEVISGDSENLSNVQDGPSPSEDDTRSAGNVIRGSFGEGRVALCVDGADI